MYAILLALLFPAVAFAQSCSVDSLADSIKSFITTRVDTRFTSAETRLNTCEANHTSHFSSINLLTLDLDAAKDDITALRTDVTSAENIISDHETRLTALETLMSSIPTGSSTYKAVVQTAHGFSVGNWIYHNGTQYALTDSDAAATSYSFGVVTTVTDADTFTVTTEGYVTGLTGLTAGVPHYLSGTAGAITPTAPSANIKAVLIADSATSGTVQQYEVGASSQALTYGRVNAAANLATKSFVSTGVGSSIDFTATVYSSGMTFSGTNGITPSTTSRFRASWYINTGSDETAYNATILVVQGGVSLGSVYINQHNSAGSVNQTSGFIDVQAASGTPVYLYYQPTTTEIVAFDQGSYFQLSELPTASATVVDGTVSVDDQAAGGYFDIGTMRMQWGTHNDGNVDTTTVTLPVAFANTSYSVVSTSNTSAGSLCCEAKTTTTFDIDRASTTTTTQTYSWFAIGLKP